MKKNVPYCEMFNGLRSEFVRRLTRVDCAIYHSLYEDRITGDLLPSLFSLFAYLLYRNPSEMVRKKF